MKDGNNWTYVLIVCFYRSGIGYTVEESKNVKRYYALMLAKLIYLFYRNLLFGIFLGVPCVTVCYVLVNIAYFAGLSKSEILSSPATALVSWTHSLHFHFLLFHCWL